MYIRMELTKKIKKILKVPEEVKEEKPVVQHVQKADPDLPLNKQREYR